MYNHQARSCCCCKPRGNLLTREAKNHRRLVQRILAFLSIYIFTFLLHHNFPFSPSIPLLYNPFIRQFCTMCIVIVTTSHPDYPLILVNNRDVCQLSYKSCDGQNIDKAYRNTSIDQLLRPTGGLRQTNMSSEAETTTDQSMAPGLE